MNQPARSSSPLPKQWWQYISTPGGRLQHHDAAIEFRELNYSTLSV
jgi:hypothetical protein